jgi:hypothetical protein
MSGTSVATALQVAQSLLRGVDFDPATAEQQFGEAYGLFFELYNGATDSLKSAQDRHLAAITIADYARAVLRSEMTKEAAGAAIQASVKVSAESDYTGSAPARGEADLSQLILNSEAEILKAALRVRRAIEQLPLGQDVPVAVEYALTLISDQSKRYAVAGTQGLTDKDGYHVFIATMPILTDIVIEAWGRLGNTYYNPSETVFTRSYVRSQMSELSKYLEAYDMGLGDRLSSVLDDTADFIFDIADREGQTFDSLPARDRQGMSIGIAKYLIAISQRAWRLCINNLISEVDDLLADEEKAMEWLDSKAQPIDSKSLFRAIERVYVESPEFSHDADIDLETLDTLVMDEFGLTVQAADAMVEEMSPWTMS